MKVQSMTYLPDTFDTNRLLLTFNNVEDFAKDMPLTTRKALQFALQIDVGALDIDFPGDKRVRIEGKSQGPEAKLIVHNYRIADRILAGGDVGVAEAYFAGDWSSPNITQFLELFCRNSHLMETLLAKKPLIKAWLNLIHWLNSNTKFGSRRNISRHYDLGNAFYEKWLDQSMTYSSALFETGANDMETAQKAKYRSLADETQIREGDEILEIGCGWGGFAEYLATVRGAKVKALTISREQYDYARSRIAKAGLNEQVQICFQDYRDETGTYDKIVSVEMFEAVGEKYWPVFFNQMNQSLRPGGLAGLQIITIQDRFFEHYRRTTDFIQRYIFPGGMLPSPKKLNELGEKHGLSLSSEKIFGQDYARTLAEWRERFHDAWPKIQPLGFDDKFRTMWSYYLSYCEAGFRAGNIDVRQVIYAKPQ
jgi:cyclopropane-fatty-acyl-phospholipid synthase